MPAARHRSRSPLHRMRRQRDDRQAGPTVRFARADHRRRLEAVHVRHLHVHQHGVEGRRTRPPRARPSPIRPSSRCGRPSRASVSVSSWFTGLSSATESPDARPATVCGVRRGRGPWPSATPKKTTNENVLPCPTALSTQIRPPISSHELLRRWSGPSPVPPNRRVVEPSACVEGVEDARAARLGECRCPCR